MARVAPLPSNASTLYFIIDHSVGKGGRNLLPDVQLVQTHLNKILDDREKRTIKYPDVWKGHEFRDAAGNQVQKLKVDGLCGPKTLGAIIGFQNNFAVLAKDGRISAIKKRQHSAYISAGYIMHKTMFKLVLESHIYAGTTISDITVEPLRSILIRSFVEQNLGDIGRLWFPMIKTQK
ncbi:MAG: hypothetical protein KF685_07810 [Acidobacteria bacterium]|nr:hypothetical protein [Acidobacteriota bacterium]